MIVFCGVHFMAETAKIISPEKTVLMPEPKAGCPMADMITAEQLRDLKESIPGAKVLCYVNTTAGSESRMRLCCTSANAERMVQKAFPVRRAGNLCPRPVPGDLCRLTDGTGIHDLERLLPDTRPVSCRSISASREDLHPKRR